MKKLIITIVIFGSAIISTNGQCTCNYSYSGALIDTVIFTNLSTVSNAHYYWNFGDGSGSNETSPTHIYYRSGEYLVTLYGLDTISNCTSVYENWISVVRPDTISCNVFFTDTISGSYLLTTDLSSNCTGLHLICRVAGPSQAYCGAIGLGEYSALYLHSMDAYTNDSINGYNNCIKDYFRTRPYQYSSSENYQDCSANFEINIDYQSGGALVTFTAMNKNATLYKWTIVGVGGNLYGSVVDHLFPYYYDWHQQTVFLRTDDTVNNCSDTIAQEFIIVNPYYPLHPANCSSSVLPQNQTATVGSSIPFTIATSPYAYKQWEQDAGLGYVNLTNAGPYSGVHTDTLTVSNVQLTMNNYHFRCVVSSDTTLCHNTLPDAILTVYPVGIDEIDVEEIKIYPNPAFANLEFSLPQNIDKAEIRILNLLGELEMDLSVSKKQSSINISNLPRGIYILEATTETSISRQKFMKE